MKLEKGFCLSEDGEVLHCAVHESSSSHMMHLLKHAEVELHRVCPGQPDKRRRLPATELQQLWVGGVCTRFAMGRFIVCYMAQVQLL